MAKKKTSRRSESEPEATPPKTKRKFLGRFVLLLLVLAALFAAGPTIISQTPVCNYLLGKALSAEGWKIETQEANLSWTGNQSLSGFSIIDPNGEPLFTADSIRCDRSLLGLATNWNNLGKVEIQQPFASIITREDGSNVEDLLADMDSESSASTEPVEISMQLELVGAEVHGLDTTSQQKWSLTDGQISGSLDGATYDLTGSGKLALDQTGDVGSVQFKLQPGESGQQQLSLLAERLPLEVLQPWVARTMPGAQLRGTLTINAPEVRWQNDPQRGLVVQTNGQIEGERIAFTADALAGDRLYWDQLTAPWQITVANNQIAVENLSLQAGWTQLQARGAIPLSALAAQNLAQLPNSQLAVQGNVNLQQVAAMLPHALNLQDGVRVDSGRFDFQAEAKSQPGGLAWTASASVNEVAGSNQGRQIRLQQPVVTKLRMVSTSAGIQLDDLSLNSSFVETQLVPRGNTIEGKFAFNLAELAREVGQFVDLSAWQLSGQGQGQVTLALDSEQSIPNEVSQLQGTITDLRVIGDSVSIDEPRVNFAGKIAWDTDTQSFNSPEFEFAGSTLALRIIDLAYSSAENAAPVAQGTIAFRANLERVAGALGLTRSANATWPRGSIEGSTELSSENGNITANMRAQISQLELFRNPQTPGRAELLWSEPQIQLTAQAGYASREDRAQLSKLQVLGKTLQLTGGGSVEQMSTKQMLQAEGDLQYDSQELARLLMGYLGPDVQLQGDRQLHFSVSGPISEINTAGDSLAWTQSWDFSADAGWKGASIYGLPIGSGKLAGAMKNGQLQITPLNVNVGKGSLTASPQVSLQVGAEQVFLPQGPLLTNVSVSPEVSQNILRYIAPVLAGATRTTGEFSVNLAQAQVPINNPTFTSVAGQLSVHSLSIEPGPMMQEMESIIRQLKSLSDGKQFLSASTSRKTTALKMADRSIEFQVAQGRVHHRNLVFEIDDVPITSNGSVGFDQTLDLTFDIPLQDKWLGERLRSMSGQVIRIPVQGTFQNPRVDSRVIAELSSKFLQNAAGGLIEDELNRQFDKLFRKR